MKPLSVVMLSVLAAACGGGGSSGTGGGGSGGGSQDVEGLQMPQTMSVVTASEVSSDVPRLARSARNFAPPAGSDYSTDPVNTYVYDESMQALDTVNMILCLMDQTKASDMVGEGAYIALVNEDKCEQGSNGGGQTGQASGGTVASLNAWTVLSTREDNDSDQVVQMWVPGDEGGDPMDSQVILPELTASEGVSASKPFGSFSMNFKGVVEQGGGELTTMKGSLATVDNAQNKPQFRFINLSGDALAGNNLGFSRTEAANVILDDASGDSGKALTEMEDTWTDHGGGSRGSAYAVAFNADYLYRGKDNDGNDTVDATSCLARNQFDTQVWRYNLYHAADGDFGGAAVTAGQRVAMNGGFPFTWDDNGQSRFGWVGYHGLWAEGDQSLPDGTAIQRENYADGTSTPFTVNVSGGKLIRKTANDIDLSDLQGMPLRFWGEHPNYSGAWGEWQIEVNGDNDFVINASVTWGESGPEFADAFDHDQNPGTPDVAVAATVSLSDNEHFGFWAEALGGHINYLHDSSVLAANRSATFYGHEQVGPDDAVFNGGALTLYCYDNCLKGGLSQNDYDNQQTTYPSGEQHSYSVTAVGGKLVVTDDSNSQPVDASALTLGGFNNWGMNTGEMVPSPLANANEWWRVWEADTSYRWETGPNNWNQLVTVSDGQGTLASFDRPMHFTYVHNLANDANSDASHDGDTFVLQYEGNGQLHGFPWEEDSETKRWYSAVTLADGTVLTDGQGNQFLVKAVEKEQTLAEVAEGQCTGAGLSVAGLFADPDLALPAAGDVGEVSHTLADKPTVTDAPAVIEGELQI